MANLLSPGVMFTESDNTTTAPAVSMSSAAFAGDFSWGPAMVISHVSSEVNLVKGFGKPTANNYLSFFSAANFLAYGNNLKLVRAANTSSLNAVARPQVVVTTQALSNTVIMNTSTDLNAGDSIQINGSSFSVLSVDSIANTAVIPGFLPASSTDVNVSFATHIKNENDYELSYNVGMETKFGEFYARYPGDLGNSLSISICSSSKSFSNTTSVKTTSSSSTVTFKDSAANVAAYLTPNDYISIEGGRYSISSISGNTAVVSGYSASATSDSVSAKTSWKYASNFDSAPGTSLYASRVGGSNDEMHIVVVDTQGKFPKSAGIKDTIIEIYPEVSKASDAKSDDGLNTYYANKILNDSSSIYVADHINSDWGVPASGTTFSSAKNYYISLNGGISASPSDGDLMAAYDLFDNSDFVDISLIISGGSSSTVAGKAIDIATSRRDAVAFVSPPLSLVSGNVDVEGITNYRTVTLNKNTSYAVMDSGWKYQFDKYNNVYRYIPLNADIAGLCARTDALRDSWWSPAGTNRGQILNAIKLAWNPNQSERDELYKVGINPVVALPGQGIVLYGDKTMQGKSSAFDRINVRRLFIFLEKTISNAARNSLFEFNDEFTRAQFVNLVEPFLRDVKGRRGIYDYRVVCDATNNTPQIIDTNQFVGDIYIKPARSINFIKLNFVAVNTGVSFNEIAGSP